MDDNNVQNSLCINHFNKTGTQWTDRGPWAFYCILWPIYEKLVVIFSLVIIHMSALWWGLAALKFSFTWVRQKGPQDWNLKLSYQIVSLFDMYIDMGERIAGKQDRPSLINSPKYTFLAPPAEWQRSFSNADSSVVLRRLSSTFHLNGWFLKNGLITFFHFWHGASLGRY